MRVFVDLETETKPRFLNHEDPRAWFLTDLEKGATHEPPKPLFCTQVLCGLLWYLMQRRINALKRWMYMARLHSIIGTITVLKMPEEF